MGRVVVLGYLFLGRQKWMRLQPTQYGSKEHGILWINDILLEHELPQAVRQVVLWRLPEVA